MSDVKSYCPTCESECFVNQGECGGCGTKIIPPSVESVIALVRQELERAAVWPLYHSAHEGYAVLLEEVDELWDEIRKKQSLRDRERMIKEAVQVATVAIRFVLALGKNGERQ